MTGLRIAHPFWFVRHGETHWNAVKRAQGQQDTALSRLGRDQARELVGRLSHIRIDRIVSSPLSRVRDTAEPIAAAHWLDVQYEEGLRECGLGAGEGSDHKPWLKAYWAGTATPEGAEPFSVFAARAVAALERSVDRPNVLIVAHGGIWRALLEHVDVEPKFFMTNAAPALVTPMATGAWRVAALDGVEAAASDGRAV